MRGLLMDSTHAGEDARCSDSQAGRDDADELHNAIGYLKA